MYPETNVGVQLIAYQTTEGLRTGVAMKVVAVSGLTRRSINNVRPLGSKYYPWVDPGVIC